MLFPCLFTAERKLPPCTVSQVFPSLSPNEKAKGSMREHEEEDLALLAKMSCDASGDGLGVSISHFDF